MTWKADGPQGNESAKIRWEIVPYTRGRVLDLGCGPYKAFNHFIGVDNGHHAQMFGHQFKPDLVSECDKLSLIASQSCDAVFSSHLLEHFDYEKVPDILKEWTRVIRPGGHLILYVPDEDEYPKVGQPGANPDHRWDVNYELLVDAMESVSRGWDMVEFEKRNQGDEYSLLAIFRMS